MATYLTEQKKMLLSFLSENRQSAYTVEELIACLKSAHGDRAPGKSTVYRLITRLTEEGSVKRFVKGHGRHFVYQIVDCESCHSHLHLKCVGCGRLIHLDSKTSDELIESVRRINHFSVMEDETVLFGQCAECNEAKGGI